MEIVTKLTAKPNVLPLYKETVLELKIPNEKRGELVLQWADEDFDPDKEYEIIVRKARKRRSLDANAYAWVLISKLSQKLRMTPIDVYRRIVADSANYYIFPILEDAVPSFRERWANNGKAWLTEDMGPCRRTPGYRNIKCFYGSSSYSQTEMSAFIDQIIEECHEQGISTLTPREIELMKGAWG